MNRRMKYASLEGSVPGNASDKKQKFISIVYQMASFTFISR